MFFRSCYSSNEPSYIIRTSVYFRFFNFGYLFISILQKIRSFSPGEKGRSLIFKTVGIQQRKKRQKDSSSVRDKIFLLLKHGRNLAFFKTPCHSLVFKI